jgi:hypothetical protein
MLERSEQSEGEKKPGVQRLRLQHFRRWPMLERAAQWEVERMTGARHLQPLHSQYLRLQRLRQQLKVGGGFGVRRQSLGISR